MSEQRPGVPQRLIESALTAYKCTLSPLLHALGGPDAGCRFQPTCSEYAAIALHEHGAVRGSWLALKRLLRCHPLARGGFDPVAAKVPGQPVISQKRRPV